MDNDWLADPTTPTPTPASQRRMLALRIGLVAVGALVGGVVVSSLHHDSTATANPSAFAGPSGTGQPPGGGPPAPSAGGFAGEQHVAGTLVFVGSSSVT